MIKEEYLNQICKECKKNNTCTKRIFHFPAENACPQVLGVASLAWSDSRNELKKEMAAWIANYQQWLPLAAMPHPFIYTEDLMDFVNKIGE